MRVKIHVFSNPDYNQKISLKNNNSAEEILKSQETPFSDFRGNEQHYNYKVHQWVSPGNVNAHQLDETMDLVNELNKIVEIDQDNFK